jgi:hypothetical protein
MRWQATNYVLKVLAAYILKSCGNGQFVYSAHYPKPLNITRGSLYITLMRLTFT